eukprot:m.33202 g.33202  ORF g.33202 m.33202 type:complete len:219 (-) comp9451_c0_seq2:42-698(-)
METSEAHSTATRLKLQIQQALEKLPTCELSLAPQREQAIEEMLGDFDKAVERLTFMIVKEPVTRRATARMVVDALLIDARELRTALQSMIRRRTQKEKQAREREELINSKFVPNDATALNIDAAIEHNRQLTTATGAMDDLLANARGILGNLHEQRGVLKGAQRRLLDIANTLGLSNSVMRFIEQRETQDRFILFAGMIITLLVMYAFYYYFVLSRRA